MMKLQQKQENQIKTGGEVKQEINDYNHVVNSIDVEEEIIVKLEPVRDDIGVQESEGAAHAGVKQNT